MILGVPSPSKMIVSPSRLDAISQTLAQEQDFLRIKKLLIYACTQIWQSDPEQLQAVDLTELLQTLLATASTPESLQTYLHNVVGTLNKAADYASIAETLIAHVNPLYPKPIPTPIHASVSQYQDRYQSIATTLSQNAEQLRIKKLLILACKNEWLSDRTRLAQVDWMELIPELHRLAPTLESLQVILASRVKKLSKQEEYRCISHQVVQAMQLLYVAHSASVAQPVSTTDATEFLSDSFNHSTSNHSTSNHSTSNHDLTHHLTHHDLNHRSTPPAKAAEVPPVAAPLRFTQSVDAIDLFDVRLELMHYSNPLRLKILLFSLLHEIFTPTSDHYSMLKGHELDELLRILLQTYRQFDDLTAKLSQTAAQLDRSGDYGAVAQTVLRSVKSLYLEQPAEMGSGTKEEVKEGVTGLMRSTAISDGLTRPEYS